MLDGFRRNAPSNTAARFSKVIRTMAAVGGCQLRPVDIAREVVGEKEKYLTHRVLTTITRACHVARAIRTYWVHETFSQKTTPRSHRECFSPAPCKARTASS